LCRRRGGGKTVAVQIAQRFHGRSPSLYPITLGRGLLVGHVTAKELGPSPDLGQSDWVSTKAAQKIEGNLSSYLYGLRGRNLEKQHTREGEREELKGEGRPG